MKIPNVNCKIEMFSSVNPSEDTDKIQTAISNIFPQSTIKIENFSIVAESTTLESLEKIYEIIHSNKSQNTYRRALEKNLENQSTWFYLNKQAAFAGKIVICEESNESPLGPIKVVFTSSNIDRIIDWIIAKE